MSIVRDPTFHGIHNFLHLCPTNLSEVKRCVKLIPDENSFFVRVLYEFINILLTPNSKILIEFVQIY